MIFYCLKLKQSGKKILDSQTMANIDTRLRSTKKIIVGNPNFDDFLSKCPSSVIQLAVKVRKHSFVNPGYRVNNRLSQSSHTLDMLVNEETPQPQPVNRARKYSTFNLHSNLVNNRLSKSSHELEKAHVDENFSNVEKSNQVSVEAPTTTGNQTENSTTDSNAILAIDRKHKSLSFKEDNVNYLI